ncbi:MAG: tRNA (adenosine(37)-N6)-threonylcarbamoyltransferase complex transferase subunit TsaD [Pseudomonadota bacterium]
MPKTSTVLAIETSCDETAASVVRGAAGDGDLIASEIMSNVVASQMEEHAPYGGVVPEIAARAHVEIIDDVIARALVEAHVKLDDVDAIAATAGPGLNGGLMVGLTTAKALASAANKRFYAVNHLEGHALTARLTDGLAYPYVLLLVSGGHTQIVLVEGPGRYKRMGTTIDDALGEAFDKTAKLLGLPYPGGPAVEAAAKQHIPAGMAIELPKPMVGRDGFDFSFSGLKTAVRQAAQKFADENDGLTDEATSAICHGFQTSISAVLTDRVGRALDAANNGHGKPLPLVVAGGVAANQAVRQTLETVAASRGSSLIAPPIALCTDNAAMIAWAAIERRHAGLPADDFTVAPRPRWPLDETVAPKVGSGKRGAKA